MLFLLIMWFLFFFKQKTAYEVRISDWSSDVCSSDLDLQLGKVIEIFHHVVIRVFLHPLGGRSDVNRYITAGDVLEGFPDPLFMIDAGIAKKFSGFGGCPFVKGKRSEEHTSELQSLMRISYAGFCLKKTKQ